MPESTIINSLLKKIGEVISNAAVDEENSPREDFVSMYVNKKEDVKGEAKAKPEKPIEKEKLRYIYLKPKTKRKAVLQELEAINREKEQMKQEKEEMSKEKEAIDDQHKSMLRAKAEAEKQWQVKTEK